MHRVDNSDFLLYIEPKTESKNSEPINDDVVKCVKYALSISDSGTANYNETNSPVSFRKNDSWRGFHDTECGQRSDNKDYLLPNGMVTNSLCIFYLQYYRDSIPSSEMEKVNKLVKWVNENITS